MNTKFYLPRNIFSQIILSEIEDKSELYIEFLPSSMISKRLSDDNNSVGLIPTLDLITNKDLFVSSEIGISFDALLSNAYIHFKEEQEIIDELFLRGDVTSNEVILSKILFKEFYDVEIKTTLLNREVTDFKNNILTIGDENYEKELFLNGLSFAEEIIELINAPYVNFVLAGNSEEVLKDFNSKYKSSFAKGHADNYENLFPVFPQTSLDFLSVNIQHLVFDFEEQDREGINQLLQMPYFHGMIKEIIEVKFV
ncbi:MAG: hypothetical protein IH618_17010 [Ignavibacteriaceae bacterium]|nr:hypothetical protein [Ignavibacteriaceae bacterium]